jgi:hypothetical protein
VFVILRFIATGKVLEDIPVQGQHVVFALDLSVLVPELVVAGVLLWRRTALGYATAAVVTVMGSLVLLNLLLAAAFQASAEVPGVKAFPPEGVAMALGMTVSALLLLGIDRAFSPAHPRRGGEYGRRSMSSQAGRSVVPWTKPPLQGSVTTPLRSPTRNSG